MRQSSDLIREIEQILPPSEAVQALSALRQDPLVWRSLEQADFLREVLDQSSFLIARQDPSACWSPARLALLALGETRPLEVLRANPLPALDGDLQERALQAYQVAQRSVRPPAALPEAALLALALRERRRLTGTWSGMLLEILPKTGQADPAAAFSAWSTALACLYGMVADPEDMLRGLLPKSFLHTPFNWILHTQLSQPQSETQHAQVFSQLLKGLPVTYQLALLRGLSLRGREALAGELAGQLAVGHPAFANLRTQTNVDNLDLAALAGRALSLQQMGAFYQLSGDRTQALALYNAAEIALAQWQAGLALQRLNLNTAERGRGALVENNQSAVLASAAGWLKDELGVVLAGLPYASSVIEQVSNEYESPFLQIKRARQMLDREPGVARDLARQGAAGLLAGIRSQGLPFSGDFVYSWRPEDAPNLLLELDLPEDALDLVRALLGVRPADPRLLLLSSKILKRLSRLDEATQAARSAVALDPQDAVARRMLANLWSQAGAWEQSLAEWQAVLALSPSPVLADRLACAQMALKAGQPEQAAAGGEAILAEDANNGAALGLVGQALVAQGKLQPALSYLVRATLLSPETLAPWLVLAHVQTQLGEPQRALETLRAAVTAVPEAPEAHLALGEACVTAGLLAESLPHLKKAFMITPDSVQAALLYGQTLRILGHSAEARTVLEKVREAWSANPELAYEYAQVLLDLNDPESALPILENALRGGLPVLDASLLYARILLGEYRASDETWDAETTGARLQQAGAALRPILNLNPDNLEARFLMADILRERGDLEEALAAYQALAESPVTGSPELRWRVQWGLGRTAQRLGQTDIALAALKEACQARPDSLPLQRSLAEACLGANLPHEALEAASYTLQLAPDEVETLAWYADFVTRAGEARRAVEALQRAVQLDPGRADLLVSLAGGQASAGDLGSARATLESLNNLAAVDRADLRRAAHVYLRLEDPRAALDCFQRAVAADDQPPADLLFEAAQVYERTGDLEGALDLTQRAIDDTTDSLPVHLFQADLLARLNRPQAALAVLERALRIAEEIVDGGEAGGEGATHQNAEDSPSQRILGEIHERFTRLMLEAGDLPAALHHAEKALGCHPGSAALRLQAVDLALAQLKNERAGRMMTDFPVVQFEQGRDGLELLALHAEMALDGILGAGEGAGDTPVGETQPASGALTSGPLSSGPLPSGPLPSGPLPGRPLLNWIEAALRQDSTSPRLLSAKARLLARRGDLAGARRAYDTARLRSGDQAALWLGEAALEAQAWDAALATFERCAQVRPGEARAQLAYARALTLCAERQRLCEAARCRTNAPGAERLSEASRQHFEDAARSAAHLASAGEVGRWQARGMAVFTPTAQAARALASMPAQPDDTAALVAVLRRLNNRAAAIQVASRQSDRPQVLLQLALCYLDDPTLKGLPEGAPGGVAAGVQAVAANPNEPLAHAVLGALLARTGELSDALAEYENALLLWTDEPDWHDAAGDLCLQVGDVQAAIQHRRQALSLDPGSAHFAFKLGQACLSCEDVAGAIAYLEKSTAQDPGQANVWLTLASAYHMADRLPQALEAARKASELDSTSAEALLIAGETALSMNLSDEALDFAQGAVRREPENAGAVLFLSSVLVQRGRMEEGLEVLDQAAPSVKSTFPVAFERAKLIHRLHGPQAALELLEKLAHDYPEEPDLLGYLARTQAECGETKSAQRYAFKALRLDPNQPELTLMLGRLQRNTGQLDQAVYLLGEAIRMDAQNLEPYLELASVYEQRREYALALQVYRQAQRVSPGDYRAFYQSGLILRDSKDYSAAENMLRRAAELAPDNLSIRRSLVAVIALNLVHNKQEVSA